MGARRPLIAAAVALAVILSFGLVAAAGSSPPRAATAVDPTVTVGTLFISGVTAQGQTTPVVAFDWAGKAGVSSGGGGGVSKPTIGPFSFTREIDQYSHKLWRLMLTGAHVGTVIFELRVGDTGALQARYKFSQVTVSSFHHFANGTPDYEFGLDEVTIKFRKVCVEGFVPFNQGLRGGSSEVCYDLATNIVS